MILVDMVNATFNNLTLLIKGDATETGQTFNSPFLSFDSSNGTFALSLDENVSPMTINTSTLYIYFNNWLYNLIPFQATTQNTKTQAQHLITLTNRSYSNQQLILNGNSNTKLGYIQTVQECCTLGLLNPVKSIIFSTNTLPINATMSSAPKIVSDSNLNASAEPNLINELTDIEIPITSVNQYRPEIIYQPSAEYRLIDLNFSTNLTKIDIVCYWKSKLGNLNPVYLQAGAYASIKLMFRHKAFNGLRN